MIRDVVFVQSRIGVQVLECVYGLIVWHLLIETPDMQAVTHMNTRFLILTTTSKMGFRHKPTPWRPYSLTIPVSGLQSGVSSSRSRNLGHQKHVTCIVIDLCIPRHKDMHRPTLRRVVTAIHVGSHGILVSVFTARAVLSLRKCKHFLSSPKFVRVL